MIYSFFVSEYTINLSVIVIWIEVSKYRRLSFLISFHIRRASLLFIKSTANHNSNVELIKNKWNLRGFVCACERIHVTQTVLPLLFN